MGTEALSTIVAALFATMLEISGDSVTPRIADPPLPEIHRVPRSQVESMTCGKPCAISAIFVPHLGIFIDSELDVQNDNYARSVLLHELVHHAQSLAAKFEDMGPCEAWRWSEREAYAIQNAYLERIKSATRVRADALAAMRCR